MMRFLLALLLSLLAGTVAIAAPPRDWTTVVTTAPGGGYVIGNPAAKVKLVEYVSYTCPHCGHFIEQSRPVLMRQMVRSGSTSVEIRNQLHDKVDLVAVVLARCAGTAHYLAYHEAAFAKQDDWYRRAAEYDQTGAVAALATNQARARAFADKSGLTAIARQAGMTQRQIDACFATDATIAAVAKSAAAIRADVDSTPSFEINGKLVLHVTWAELEPMLRAAGAK
jgi:protein-disulfide isomerase